MTQTSNRILDEFARFMTDAAGVAKGVRSEVETVVRTQAEKVLRDLDVVHREEFEAVKEMAAKARAENEKLHARLLVLEHAAGVASQDAGKTARKSATARTATAKSATARSGAAKSKTAPRSTSAAAKRASASAAKPATKTE